ncbi:MAG: hypothetical protein LH650_04865 [Chloroflexi bacterium]|nr:hypothetical protein [Chloroflexota bacterium]
MRDGATRFLACPRCRGALTLVGSSVRCPMGHTFDIARAGYVSMLDGVAPGVAADSAGMVAARRRSLDEGHFCPVSEALVAAALDAVAGRRTAVVVDVGGGTGHYLAAVLDALPDADGLVVDLSRDAARVAARMHPRMSAAVCDVHQGLPLGDGAVSLLLDVFAPRDGGQMRRVLAPDGVLLVVTPAARHLGELRGVPGMLRVDEHKQERLERSLAGFRLAERHAVEWRMSLDRAAARDVVMMGPSAHHVDPTALAEALAAFADPLPVTGSVEITRWLPAAD